jgi:ribosomal protein S18 acetylase RimI-like enzyme
MDRQGRRMTFGIRPLEARDRSKWDGLWKEYQLFYKSVIAAETSDLTFARLLDAAIPMHGFVAEQAGEVIGMTHCIFHYSAWTEGPYCYLQDLVTSSGHRGKGAATALIESVYAFAAAKGAARVYWLTHETNENAIRLYEKVADRSGFIQFRKMLG